MPNGSDRRVRYAVVGLGWISQAALLPGFANAHNAQLTALVSDSEHKLRELGKRYNIPRERQYTYDQYDECLKSGDVDAVYIGLPNHLHREYTVRAAQAGVHVLCEKPMAPTEADCQAMIRAAEASNVKLMIAYRLHFEEANLTAIDRIAKGEIGEPRQYVGFFTEQVEEGNIRLRDETGGGTLWDIGVYCINAARYLFQANPIEASAMLVHGHEPRFREVEETTSAILRFPDDRVAAFTCGFGSAGISTYQVAGSEASLRLDPGYGFTTDLKHYFRKEGDPEERVFPKRDQFGAQLVYFSDCILQDKTPEPDGYEGLTDVQIILALYESARSGAPVSLDLATKTTWPTLEQSIHLPPIEEPPLLEAEPPEGS